MLNVNPCVNRAICVTDFAKRALSTMQITEPKDTLRKVPHPYYIMSLGLLYGVLYATMVRIGVTWVSDCFWYDYVYLLQSPVPKRLSVCIKVN